MGCAGTQGLDVLHGCQRHLPDRPIVRKRTIGHPSQNDQRQVMQSRVSRLIAPLAQRIGEDASAAQIAEAVIATFSEIDAVLSPIIGTRGVAALYRRSLHLTAATHPWMTVPPEGLPPEMDLAGLQSMIA